MADKRPDYRLNSVFLKRLKMVLKILFPSISSLSMLMLMYLLAMTAFQEMMTYQVGLIPSKFYKAIIAEDHKAFMNEVITGSIFIVFKAVSYSTQNYVTTMLQITWRQQMTKYLHGIYLSGINYYRLNMMNKKISNADQRITQDVNSMCLLLSQSIGYVIMKPLIMVYYTYRTYAVVGFQGVLISYTFFIVATCANILFMTPIVKATANQEYCEGNFRFHHMQVRINAESVAFQGAEKAEYKQLNKLLKVLIEAMQTLANRVYPLFFISETCSYSEDVVSYFVIAQPIFAGRYSSMDDSTLSSLISSNAFVVGYLLKSFVRVLQKFKDFSSIAGSIHRIAEFIEEINKAEEIDSQSCDELKKSISDEDDDEGFSTRNGYVVEFKNVTIKPPSVNDDADDQNSPIIEKFSLKFELRKNVLIAGDGSCGKTSLLRVMRGLWPVKLGKVKRISNLTLPGPPNSILFLPKKPLLTTGCLLKQIIYPLDVDTDDTFIHEQDEIYENLEMVGLTSLINKCNGIHNPVRWNWYDSLTIGDAQKLSIVRLLFHKPRIAILDDVMMYLEPENIEKVYRKFNSLSITVFCVGESSLKQFHDVIVTLHGDGRYSVKSNLD